ncbi:hypothetical protein ACJX0J_010358 [Zea mays]
MGHYGVDRLDTIMFHQVERIALKTVAHTIDVLHPPVDANLSFKMQSIFYILYLKIRRNHLHFSLYYYNNNMDSGSEDGSASNDGSTIAYMGLFLSMREPSVIYLWMLDLSNQSILLEASILENEFQPRH